MARQPSSSPHIFNTTHLWEKVVFTLAVRQLQPPTNFCPLRLSGCTYTYETYYNKNVCILSGVVNSRPLPFSEALCR